MLQSVGISKDNTIALKFWFAREPILHKVPSLTLLFCRSGVFGGILATAFNNPFDVVVSRARNIIDYNSAPYKCGLGHAARV